MQKTSRSKVAMLPMFLFVVVPILSFVFLRKYGFIFFALFFNPIGAVFNQLFTTYKVENEHFKIKGIFGSRDIPISNIRYIHTRQANVFQQLIAGLPKVYQVIGYNDYDEKTITPVKPLILEHNTLYFRT